MGEQHGRCLLAILCCALCATAQAEFPLETEDALIDEVGEVQAVVRLDRDRGHPKRSALGQVELVIAEGIELQFAAARLYLRDENSGATRPMNRHEIEVKWVPFRRAHGWSVGVAAGVAVEEGAREREIRLIGSLPLGRDQAHAVHLNLGRESESEEARTATHSVLAFAYEHGLGPRLTLLAEAVARPREKPLRHAGVRYRLFPDVHLGFMLGENAAGTVARLGLLADFY
jgi:hypothetical protein